MKASTLGIIPSTLNHNAGIADAGTVLCGYENCLITVQHKVLHTVSQATIRLTHGYSEYP